MEFRYAISIVLEAHIPFVREFNKEDDLSQAGEEGRFFEFVSETLLPLLETLTRLENDHVSFRLALAISPVLCHMLNDEHLQKKYLAYIDKQIEFGRQELERTSDNGDLNKLVQDYYNRIVDRRIAYTERYEKKLLKAFDFYRRKGKVEILASCATHAFLPFMSHNSEALQAQMEVPVSGYRRHFGSCPQGFWLPDLGWTSALEPYLRAYNFTYSILDSHGVLFGKPMPNKGCFYPVKTPNGTFILARDLYAVREIEKIAGDELYRRNDRDAGYELPLETVSPFLSAEGERRRTGYKYWARSYRENRFGGALENSVYNPQKAHDRVIEHARAFLENTIARLEEASKHMEEVPISVYAHNADYFGRFWHEGPQFIEALFRMAEGYRDFQFICPSEYIFKQNLSSLQVVSPEFSSSGVNGYAETWLDVSNDWIYRHLYRSMERMTELAERFPDDSGLKERALNQAAREILLAQSSDWPALLHRQDSTEYARSQAENALRNFTTIYEALGSNYISTEWLTTLERRHNIFPNINYRVFRRKK
jgi:1,4-alpha-glucan branching enzyme